MATYCRLLWIFKHTVHTSRHEFKSQFHRLCAGRISNILLSRGVSSSSLYIRRDDMANVQTLEVDLDLQEIYSNVEELEANIQARKMQTQIDVQKLVGSYCFAFYFQSYLTLIRIQKKNLRFLICGVRTDPDSLWVSYESYTQLGSVWTSFILGNIRPICTGQLKFK